MKKFYFTLLILSFFIFICCPVFADDSLIESDVVADFGAVPNDDGDDRDAFQQAFNQIAGNENAKLIVHVPQGTYYLSNELLIYSNTQLILDPGAVIIATYQNDSCMVYGAHLSDDEYPYICFGESCRHGGHSQIHDVLIKGGTWLRTAPPDGTLNGSTSIFSFWHGNNISILGYENADLICAGASDHFINISGSSNVQIDHVTLKDPLECNDPESVFWKGITDKDTRLNSIEAIHMDNCAAEGENALRAMPYDGTPVTCVSVTNCTFENVYAGAGNHHIPDNENSRASFITVAGNTFTGLRSYCVYAYGFDNINASDNTCTACSGFFVADTSSDVVVESNYYDRGAETPALDRNALILTNVSGTSSVSNNKILGSSYCGIAAKGCSGILTINNNMTALSATHGISLTEGTSADVLENEIRNAGGSGIYVNNSNAVLSENEVFAPAKSGIRVDASSSVTARQNLIAPDNDGNLIGEYGFLVSDGSSLTASENTVRQPVQDGIKCRGSSNINLSDNLIEKTSEKGINLNNCNDLTLTDNIINNTTDTAVYISDSTNVTASSNTVINSRNTGIYFYNSDNITAEKNTVSASAGTAFAVRGGTEDSRITAVIKDNTLETSNPSEKFDLRIIGYVTLTISGNTLKNNLYKCDDTSKLPNTVTVADFTLNANPGQAQTFSLDAKALDNAAFKYSSDNSNVKVNSSGTVTIAKGFIGTANITVTAKSTDSYAVASAVSVIIVKAVPVENPITAKNFTKTTNLKKAQTFKLGAKSLYGTALTYKSNNKSVKVSSAGKITIAKGFVGKATITITSAASEFYNKATAKSIITVNPAKTTLSKVKNTASKKAAVTWNKSAGSVTGYQIQYATNKGFTKNVKTVTVKGINKVSKVISGLKKGSSYYFRIRTWQTVSKTKYYSDWSAAKSIKITK